MTASLIRGMKDSLSWFNVSHAEYTIHSNAEMSAWTAAATYLWLVVVVWDVNVNNTEALFNGPVNIWHDAVVLQFVSDLQTAESVRPDLGSTYHPRVVGVERVI